MKNLLLALLFTMGSLFTLPAFAWPEVDHMNMCGSATKVVRSYGGSSQGFAQRDRYIEQRGNAYYFRSNCPTTVAPVKKAKVAYKARKTKKVVRKAKRVSKTKSVKRITKRLRGSKKGYDKHADCVRVDRMNNYGRPVSIIRLR